ncbi:hypothetical protein GS429_01725 [Natronorubrum sp. JWXQ-INN-674]|uniref:Halobacterial output domain-containing protein n=1 Tax=Natronorubrum halalkaliphilum TaxID=2691917 RepID=A0A6B0VJN8_9EURY|nr:HalOD1 output domain-containing protein [Natronorubrum halalkaliphilum]MXV60809.1 hypothetical protein [Natronorubrum halalkaliphilum]
MSKTTRDRVTPVNDIADRPLDYDDERGTYHAWCVDTDYEPASTAVLMAVSSVRDIDPENLEQLSGRVDPDALNALVGHWTESGSRTGDNSIGFSFAQCAVTVHANGEIVIDPDHSPGESVEP